MGSAKRASTRSVGIALISQVACLTTFILGATPCLAAPAIHWLDAPPPDHEPKRIPPRCEAAARTAHHPTAKATPQRPPQTSVRGIRRRSGGRASREDAALSDGEGVPNESSLEPERRPVLSAECSENKSAERSENKSAERSENESAERSEKKAAEGR